MTDLRYALKFPVRKCYYYQSLASVKFIWIDLVRAVVVSISDSISSIPTSVLPYEL